MKSLEPLELTDEERGHIRSLIQSEAWRVLEKIHDYERDRICMVVVHARDSIRFHQGVYAGLSSFLPLVESLAESRSFNVFERKWKS